MGVPAHAGEKQGPGPWAKQGACRARKDIDFYPPTSSPSQSRPRKESPAIAAAKAVCETCPVLMECLTYAIDRPEEYGVWGGMSELERHDLRRELRVHS